MAVQRDCVACIDRDDCIGSGSSHQPCSRKPVNEDATSVTLAWVVPASRDPERPQAAVVLAAYVLSCKGRSLFARGPRDSRRAGDALVRPHTKGLGAV
jgi:hypothetical protein